MTHEARPVVRAMPMPIRRWADPAADRLPRGTPDESAMAGRDQAGAPPGVRPAEADQVIVSLTLEGAVALGRTLDRFRGPARGARRDQSRKPAGGLWRHPARPVSRRGFWKSGQFSPFCCDRLDALVLPDAGRPVASLRPGLPRCAGGTAAARIAGLPDRGGRRRCDRSPSAMALARCVAIRF